MILILNDGKCYITLTSFSLSGLKKSVSVLGVSLADPSSELIAISEQALNMIIKLMRDFAQ